MMWKNNRWRPLSMACCALLAALSLFGTGCQRASNQPGAENVIKVGEFASLTGKEATFGVSSHQGTLLAIDQVNAGGGVIGKQVQLAYEDDQSKAGEAATVVRKLISRDKVVALLGEVASSRSLEAAPIAQQAKIPMISPASTNPKVTEVGDYIFRVCFTDRFQGAVLANFMLNSLKATQVALLIDLKSDYSKGLAAYFKETFLKGGGKILAEPNYSGGDRDFNAQLTAIKGLNPQAILVPGYYTDVGLIALQARQLGLKVPLVGGDGWESPRLLEIGGEAMEGHYFSTHYSPDDKSPRVQEFVKQYRERFGQTPDALAALGYDSARLLLDAIQRAGSTDSAKLRDALAQTKDFEAVTGRITIDQERNPTKPAIILTIRQGQFQYVETIQP